MHIYIICLSVSFRCDLLVEDLHQKKLLLQALPQQLSLSGPAGRGRIRRGVPRGAPFGPRALRGQEDLGAGDHSGGRLQPRGQGAHHAKAPPHRELRRGLRPHRIRLGAQDVRGAALGAGVTSICRSCGSSSASPAMSMSGPKEHEIISSSSYEKGNKSYNKSTPMTLNDFDPFTSNSLNIESL